MQNLREQRIGEVRYNLHGEKMEIIDYINYKDITIRFEDGSIRKHVKYCAFKNGEVKNHMNADVYGVGISGYSPKKTNGKLTKEYKTWVHILQRIYDPLKQEESPNYKGCSITQEWLYFPAFEEWCQAQENWSQVIANPESFHIDKDIIVKGNKVYGPEFCSFVPFNVNVLFTKRNKARGKYPIGVSYTKHMDAYQSACCNPFTKKHINHYGFSTPAEAFEQYKKDKEEIIKKVAHEEYKKGNITTKCYEAMINYKIEITD